ncbi:DUF4265 domain-containing protein [Streptomyces sp. NPDC005803]|uniref:DUF4265 domain-containing protein n=1 Tax=Streptomyces sp. NPDC005803 TaxID=3154297 RepID=UPI0033C6259F
MPVADAAARHALKALRRVDLTVPGRLLAGAAPSRSSAAARQSVLKIFHSLGTTGEGIEQYRMVALDLPPEADLPQIHMFLGHGEAKGWWHWEKGCVTAARKSIAGG